MPIFGLVWHLFCCLDFYLSSPEPWDCIHLPTDPQRMGSKFSLTEHLRDCTVQSHSWARPHHCAAAWGLVKAKHCLFLYCFVSGVFIESRRELSNRLSAYVKEKTQRVVWVLPVKVHLQSVLLQEPGFWLSWVLVRNKQYRQGDKQESLCLSLTELKLKPPLSLQNDLGRASTAFPNFCSVCSVTIC